MLKLCNAMKKIMIPAVFALLLLGCSSGGDSSDSTEMDPQTEMEIKKSDSITQELEKVGAELKTETESVKDEVENMLEGI